VIGLLYIYKDVSNEIKSINVSIQTFELITAVASNGDTDDMYPRASTAGVEAHSLLFKITFNNETIPPVVTIILQICINYTRYNRYVHAVLKTRVNCNWTLDFYIKIKNRKC